LSRVSNIVNAVNRKQVDSGKYQKDLQPERDRLDKYLEREEEEKAKDEAQKTHERYRRKQKSVDGADLTSLIRPAPAEVKKPGTFFYGTLKKVPGFLTSAGAGLIKLVKSAPSTDFCFLL
jgi:hypothetical protein